MPAARGLGGCRNPARRAIIPSTISRQGGTRMLDDRFGNPLSTSSTAARDAYVEGCNLQLAAWAGAGDAFARAAAEDPGFALAHVGVAIVAAGRGDVAGIQSALAAAHAATAVSEREASHVAFYGLML